MVERLRAELTERYRGTFRSIHFERLRFDFSVTFTARDTSNQLVVIRITSDRETQRPLEVVTPFSVPYSLVETIEVDDRDLTVRVRPRLKATLADEFRHTPEFHKDGTPVVLREDVAQKRLVQVRDLFAGLADIHEAGIVHGDLRPANVGVAEQSLVLMDYDSVLPARYRYTHELPYAAPEALEGTYSPASDTYALGRIASLFLSTQSMLFLSPRMWTAVPPDMVRLLDATIVPDPNDRPTARDVAFLLGSSVETRPETREWARWMDDAVPETSPNEPGVHSRRWLTAYAAQLRARAADWSSPFPVARLRVGDDYLSRLLALTYTYPKEINAIERYSINEELPGGIDSAWEAQIADQIIPTDHALDAATEALVLRALDRNVHVATQLRLEMLHDHRFVSSERAARELVARGFINEPAELDTLRREGRVIYVRDHRRWIYPAFQFDLTPAQFDVIELAQRKYAEERNRWGVLSWWTTPDVRLQGRTPIVVLREDPGALVGISSSEHNGPLSA